MPQRLRLARGDRNTGVNQPVKQSGPVCRWQPSQREDPHPIARFGKPEGQLRQATLRAADKQFGDDKIDPHVVFGDQSRKGPEQGWTRAGRDQSRKGPEQEGTRAGMGVAISLQSLQPPTVGVRRDPVRLSKNLPHSKIVAETGRTLVPTTRGQIRFPFTAQGG